MRIKLNLPEPAFSYKQCDAEIAAAAARGNLVIPLVVERPLMPRVVDQLLANDTLDQLYNGDVTSRDVHLVVDLRDCTFVDPYACTVIHSLVTQVSDTRAKVWMCLPARTEVQAYCGVIGLTEALRNQVTMVGEVYQQQASQNSSLLVPLRVFSAAEDVPALIKASIETLESLLARLAWPNEIVSAVVSAIKEVTMNVVEHARARGSFALQAYKLDSDDPYIVVALSDAGVGIRATLERKYSDLPSTDGLLLSRMFERHLTSREDRQHGHGMRTLQDAVTSVRGTLHLRSGAGLYYASGKGVWHATRAPIPGTHLRLAVNGPAART